MNRYAIEIFWSDEDNAYIAIVPDLPGCSAGGDTREEALKEVHTAMKLWLEVAESMGRTLPEPARRAA